MASVSVITVTYNSAETVADTITSVNQQTHPSIEHVFVDGGSKDSTVDMVRRVSTRSTVIISEPDNGPYDAMNKGIRCASGDVIAILNSDDVYAAAGVVSRYCEALDGSGAELAYGDIAIVDRVDARQVKRVWRTGEYSRRAFLRGWHPPHPAFFATKRAYEQCGLYRTDLAVSADFELMLRMFETCGLPSAYVPTVAVFMRTGGISTGSFRNIAIGNWNVLRAFRLNGHRIPIFLPLKRLLSKAYQYRVAPKTV